MNYHRTLASAIAVYVFTVIFNINITTAVAYENNMRRLVSVSRIIGQVPIPSLSKDTHNTEEFVSVNPGFSRKC